MTVNRTTLLDLPLPVTGTESGTWGDTTNNGLTQYMDIAIAGMSNLTSANFTTGALTIETTEGNSSATNISATSAQYAGFRVTSLAQNSTITVGNTGTSPARSYRLINADATYSLTFKATGQTGVTLLPGQSAVVAFNGTDYVIVGMVGAGTATDNAVVRFDGTTGKLVQNSVVTIADSTGDVAGVGALTMGGNLTLNGGTANGVLYLNGSKVATSGSALTFDGSTFAVTNASASLALSATKSADGNTAFFRRVGGTYNPGMYISLSDTVNNEIIFNTTYSSGNAPAYVWQQAGTEQMRLTSTGLGIGTSSPAYKLDVVGEVRANNLFRTTDGTNIGLFGSGVFAGGVVGIGSSNSVPLVFGTGATERMRLDASGNLGLGVTPSAWGGGQAIQLGARGGLFYRTDLTSTELSANSYYNSGIGYVYQASAAAALYRQTSSQHQWFTAPSGTAGNAITFTQAMTLDASGNLLVGTTSARTTLTVAGSISLGATPAGGVAGTAYSIVGNSASTGNANGGDLTVVAGGGSGAGTNGNLTVRAGQTVSPASITTGGNLILESGKPSDGQTGGYIGFNTYTGNPSTATERARITSGGDLLVGTTSGSDKLVVEQSAAASASLFVNSSGTATAQCVNAWHKNTTGDNVFLQFFTEASATSRGSITYNRGGGVVAYNTTSDYRLKNVLGSIADSGARIDSLEPIEFEWKSNGLRTRGFLAHRFQEVYPNSVTGNKDAVDDKGEPIYQAMQASTSEIMADLVAEIQSLRQRVALLEGN